MADYESFTDPDLLRRLRSNGAALEDVRVLHVNSTARGGGVAELLRSLVPLFNDLGVDTEWFVMDADEAFFTVTKSLHNGLQGQPVALTERMIETYRAVTDENALEIDGDYDIVVLHDPQSLGMIDALADRFPDTRFVWRCHIDLSSPSETHLAFVDDFTERIDHAVFSRGAYGRGVPVPDSTVIHPSIDPLSDKNRPLSDSEMAAERDRLDGISVDSDTPVVTQVSRFDPWKDPIGVVDAFRDVRETVPEARLLLVGGTAADDPEGVEIYERVREEIGESDRVHTITDASDTAVNYLQRRSDTVVQKSLREGFGLVVSEALWKETPVVGSDVGGIPLQIEDGENGYLVNPADHDAAADRISRLLTDESLRQEMGEYAHSTVKERFLLPRQLNDYLELFVDIRRSP